MVHDFETSTQVQIPATDFADFVARRDKRGAGAVPEKEDTSKAVIVVPTAPYKVGHHQRTTKTQHDPKDPPNACALLAACVIFPAVSFAVDGTIAVAMHGHVSNAREIRELYGLPASADGNGSGSPLPGIEPGTPSSKDASATNSATNTRAGKVRRALDDSVKMPPPPPVRSPDLEGAALLLALYKKRFEDKDGDHSDQPATALASCEGSFSFVLLDTATNAVLASRSKHSVRAFPTHHVLPPFPCPRETDTLLLFYRARTRTRCSGAPRRGTRASPVKHWTLTRTRRTKFGKSMTRGTAPLCSPWTPGP